MLWRRGDRVSLTIVVKATLKLVPDGVSTLAPPVELFRQEKLHGQGPAIYADTDVVPYKPRVDVLYVGNAWAPRPVQALRARLGVLGTASTLEKTVQVVGDRLNATVQPAPFYRLPLTWDRAARGNQAENPLGVHAQSGRMPNLFDTKDPSVPIGLGAVPRSFPARRALLASHDVKSLETPAPPPNSGDVWSIHVPPTLPFEFFQSAPADQQLDVLHGNESLWLENLVEGTSRVHTELPAIKALARVFGASIPPQGQTLDLTADTLLIDGVEKHVTITFRGTVPIPSTEALVKTLHVLTTIEMPHMAAQWPNAAVKSAASKSADHARVHAQIADEHTPMLDDDEGGGSTKAISPEAAMAMIQARMGGRPMPFQSPGAPPAAPPPPPAPPPPAEPTAMQRPASRKPSMPSMGSAHPVPASGPVGPASGPKREERTLSPAEAEALRRNLIDDEPSAAPETTRLPLSAAIPPHLQQPYRPASHPSMPAVGSNFTPGFGAPPPNARSGPDIVVRAGPAPMDPMNDEDSSVGSTMAITPEAAAALLRARSAAPNLPSASNAPAPAASALPPSAPQHVQPAPSIQPPAVAPKGFPPPAMQALPMPAFLPPRPNPTVPDEDGETTGATMALSPEAAMAIMEKQKAEIARRQQAAREEERARQAPKPPAEDPSLPRHSTLVMDIPPELGGPPRRR